MPPTRRLGLQRRILEALTAEGAGEIDPARLAHHAEAAGDTDAVLEFAVAAAARAVSTGAYREAAAQYARALRVGGAALPAGRRAELLEGRSRACYLADDQLEAIDVVREAIASRRERAPRRARRAISTELSSYLFCRGLLGEARGGTGRGGHADRRAGGEQRGGVRRSAPRRWARGSSGDPARRRRARPAGAGDGAPLRRRQDGGHRARRARDDRAPARPRSGPRADAGGDRRGGVDRLHRATGARAQQPRRVRACSLRITRSRRPTSRRRSSSAPRTTRTSGGSTPWRTPRATLSTGAAGPRRPTSPTACCRTHASRRGRTTRRSSCSRSFGPAAAIRGRSAALDEAAAVGVPARRRRRPRRPRRGARPRSPGSSSAPPKSTRRPTAPLAAALERGDADGGHAPPLLAPARGPRGDADSRRTGRACALPRAASGQRPPPSGRARASRTRQRWRCSRRATRSRCAQALETLQELGALPASQLAYAAPARARSARHHARPAEGNARERGRPDAARERGARAGRRRLPQRPDRRAALPLAPHGGSLHLSAPAQARCRARASRPWPPPGSSACSKTGSAGAANTAISPMPIAESRRTFVMVDSRTRGEE